MAGVLGRVLNTGKNAGINVAKLLKGYASNLYGLGVELYGIIITGPERQPPEDEEFERVLAMEYQKHKTLLPPTYPTTASRILAEERERVVKRALRPRFLIYWKKGSMDAKEEAIAHAIYTVLRRRYAQ